MINATLPDTYTLAEAAAIVGISPWLYRKRARAGELPMWKLGARVVVPRVQLERALSGEWQTRR